MINFEWAKAPAPIPEAELTKREQADVVIIGAGHGGICAARAAAEAGASVIVLEQQTEEKQWILGVGEIGHINSRWQAAHGVPPVNVDEPFYACGVRKDSRKPGGQSLKLLVTMSGLMTDHHQQVLDEEFEPIPGLYATGNCSGGRFGFQYTTSLPGQSISMVQTMGREAGRRMAELR